MQGLSNQMTLKHFLSQFARIFQEELSAVIYDSKFLERRADIVAVWGEVSEILYKRKFPAIKDDLKKAILKTYLPTEVNFFYDTFKQDIEYKFLEGSPDHLVVTEIINFTVKSASKSEEIKLPYGSPILKLPADNQTKYELLELKINEKPIEAEVTQNKKETSLESTFSLEMAGLRNTILYEGPKGVMSGGRQS